jgi:hypothetical protein
MIPFIPPPQQGLVSHECAARTVSSDTKPPAAPDPFESEMRRAVVKHTTPPKTPSSQGRNKGIATRATGKLALPLPISAPPVSQSDPDITAPLNADPSSSPPAKTRTASAAGPTANLDALHPLIVPVAVSPPVVTARPEVAKSAAITGSPSVTKEKSIAQTTARLEATRTPGAQAVPETRIQIPKQSDANPAQDSETKTSPASEPGQGTPAADPAASGLSEASEKKDVPSPATNSDNAKKQPSASISDSTAQILISGRLPLPSTGPPDSVKPSAPAAATVPINDAGKDCPDPVGTSAAQQELPMKKAEKMQKTAELPQQNLPGQGTVSAGKPAQPQLSVVPSDSPTTVNPSVVEMRQVALERTHDMVAMHALRLTQSSGDTMRVVIEPGGGTRLSLELRFNNGGVEAQATLHRGDFEFLNQHWTELQQRLEPRGVHLGALENSGASTGHQRSSQQSGQQSGDDPHRSAFADFALNGPMTPVKTAPRVRTKSHPGWETWA